MKNNNKKFFHDIKHTCYTSTCTDYNISPTHIQNHMDIQNGYKMRVQLMFTVWNDV